jgi:uncharacterized MnhB-related membrane protein
MRLFNITSDREGAAVERKVFGIIAPFWQTSSKFPDLAITFQIIGTSVLIGIVVPAYVKTSAGKLGRRVKRAALYG